MRHSLLVPILLAFCSVLALPRPAAAQSGLLRVSVILVDSNLAARPVPRHVLIATRADGSGTPVRVVTGFDGKAEARLDSGAYVIESERPVEFQGRSYRWKQNVTVRPSGSATLDLSIDNAIESAAAPPAAPSVPPPASSLPPPASSGGQGGGRFAPTGNSPSQLIPKGGFTIGGVYSYLQGGGNAFGFNVDGNSWFGSKLSGVAVGYMFEFGFERLPDVWISVEGFGLRIGAVSGRVRPFAQFQLDSGHFWQSGCGNSCNANMIAPGGGVDLSVPGHNVGLRGQFDYQIIWLHNAGHVWSARMWGGLVIFFNKRPRD